jgi:hypothetical protein
MNELDAYTKTLGFFRTTEFAIVGADEETYAAE